MTTPPDQRDATIPSADAAASNPSPAPAPNPAAAPRANPTGTDSATGPPWAAAADRLVNAAWFRRSVLTVILAAGVLVGVETYGGLVERHAALFHALDTLILTIFIVEILLRLAAYGWRPWRFFLDPWNVFDFLIVAVCLLPMDGKFAAVARLARVLRVLRLMSAIPRLQVIVNALFHAIPAISYVMLLVGLLFYVYAVVGTGLFSANDPWHFGNLHVSLLTLFRVITLEDWTDVMYIQMVGSANWNGYPGPTDGSVARPILSAFYFVSFVLIGTMIVLNFFVGVVLNSLDESQRQQAAALIRRTEEDEEADALQRELAALTRQSQELQERIVRVAERHAAAVSGGGPRTAAAAEAMPPAPADDLVPPDSPPPSSHDRPAP